MGGVVGLPATDCLKLRGVPHSPHTPLEAWADGLLAGAPLANGVVLACSDASAPVCCP